MDPSSRPQHHQDMASHQTLESMLVCTKAAQAADKKPRPAEQALKCPRCDSSNTKFCYYNNYSLTQPRYFCKSCRRYWTKGGTLRNVPVGGGCRKNKRSSSSSSSSYSSSSKIRTQDQQHPLITANHNNPLLSYDSTDLSLAFARLQNGQLGFDHQHHENDHFSLMGNPSNNHGFLDALRSGFLETPINGFQNVYFRNNMASNGGDHMGNVENVGGLSVNVSEEMGNLPYEDLMSGSSGATTTAVTVTTVKQEGCNGSRQEAAAAESGRVLWGYPWQVGGGDGGSIMGDVDAAGRQSSWINGLGSSNWHGLLNSPLMYKDVRLN